MLKLEKIDRSLLRTTAICESHIPELHALWACRYQPVRAQYDYLPRAWLDDTSMFAHFIEQHVGEGNGIVTLLDDTVIGFMTYDAFDFHAEPTAFFPIMAHAAHEDYKLVAYSEMYNTLSQTLVDKGCLNHMMTFFAPDQRLQEYLYELGFGLYLVDAYRDQQPITPGTLSPDIEVKRAHSEALDPLSTLVKESDSFYHQAPLFLMREADGKEAILEMLTDDNQAVFVAAKGKRLLGFIHVRCHDENDVFTLRDTSTATIDPLGAYIKKEYRGAGIGRQLLHEAITWCCRQNISTIHVDFESANYHANQFWPRYFTPILYSVKRRLNNDVV
ncbi:MAG: GNAT family N-acetyltransferase [Anaerolineae bacterium]|nr:GNAT family N-acetyltransferase [Anaerolineae bacterium]